MGSKNVAHMPGIVPGGVCVDDLSEIQQSQLRYRDGIQAAELKTGHRFVFSKVSQILDWDGNTGQARFEIEGRASQKNTRPIKFQFNHSAKTLDEFLKSTPCLRNQGLRNQGEEREVLVTKDFEFIWPGDAGTVRGLYNPKISRVELGRYPVVVEQSWDKPVFEDLQRPGLSAV